jgi:hypothetical protein
MLTPRPCDWLAVLLVGVGIVLGGCERDTRSLSTQLADYESSLRDEANWLWDRMNYTRTHFNPDPALCQDRDFQHRAVMLDKNTRQTNRDAAHAADRLDEAAYYIRAVRQHWDAYCDGASVNPTYMEKYLRDAYDRMNQARVRLKQEPRPPG